MHKSLFQSRRAARDLYLLVALSVLVFIMAGRFDILESIIAFFHRYEEYELDEILTVFVFLSFGSAVFAFRRWGEHHLANKNLERSNRDLIHAMAEIKHLKSILPICASCKAIRDENGEWHTLETYIENNTGTIFTHSICDNCTDKLYPGLFVTPDQLKKE